MEQLNVLRFISSAKRKRHYVVNVESLVELFTASGAATFLQVEDSPNIRWCEAIALSAPTAMLVGTPFVAILTIVLSDIRSPLLLY